MGVIMDTAEQQKEAINLAMKIDTGTIDIDSVLDCLDKNPSLEMKLVQFWMNFNVMTKSALTRLAYEKARRHLKRCLEVS